MKKDRFLFWSVVVALGGFLFGFDTAVISGVEKSLQQYWKLNTIQNGLTISIALVGTVIGSLLGAIPSDKLGRKSTLYIIGILYLVSALGTAQAGDWHIFLVFRFIGGIGVGASTVTVPIYISEISPAGKRGRLVALFQFNIVLGILASYLSNYLLGHFLHNSWRMMLAIQAVPSALLIIMLRFVPESPRWLIMNKRNMRQAVKTLKLINPASFNEDLLAIKQSAEKEAGTHKKEPLFSMLYRTPIMLTIMFAFFSQVSGIQAIIYYSPSLFEMTGFGTDSSMLSTVGIGVINVLFTLLAMNFIDFIGRKTIMIIGSFGLIVTLSLVSISFFMSQFNTWLIPLYLFIYTGFFAFSQGAVLWVFISEIFPNHVRAKGQTLGSTTHWVMAALIALLFPYLVENAGAGNVFLFFSFMMCMQLIFVWKLMPETKGRSLEQIEERLISH